MNLHEVDRRFIKEIRQRIPNICVRRSGERILFESLLSGCCAISGFGRHLGLADHSPRFPLRALSPRSSQLQLSSVCVQCLQAQN